MADFYFLVLVYLVIAIHLLSAVMITTIPRRKEPHLQAANHCFLAYFLGMAAAAIIFLRFSSDSYPQFGNVKIYFVIASILFLVAGARMRIGRPIKEPLLYSFLGLGLIVAIYSHDRASVFSVLSPFYVVVILWGIDGFFRIKPSNRGDVIIGVTLSLFALFLMLRIVTVSWYGVGNYDFIVAVSVVSVTSFALCCGLISANLCDSNAKLMIKAGKDSMTGLANRNYFEEVVAKELASARRYGYSLSMVMCDLDKFKFINDSYGHSVGDQVIIAFAKLLKSCSREADICTRFGGEEFLLLLPYTNLQQAQCLAERIRRATEDLMIAHQEGGIAVTSSFGVAELQADLNHQELLKRADEALYRAKSAGRNCVRVYSGST